MINLSLPTGDDLKTAAAILTLLFGGGVVTNVLSKWRERRQQKLAVEQLPVGDFHPSVIKSALRYYVEHEVSAIDPAGREVDRASLGPREPLFRLLDRTLYQSDDKQHLLLLADSGMGKTTAFLNYYAYNAKRKRPHPIMMFSLRTQGVETKIASVQNKASTVLFLDALDEDPTAVSDHATRLHTLLKTAEEFRAVLISCRSQFFLASEEITRDTGIARIHHRGLGEVAEYLFYKFYLCPFSEQQVRTFLKRRYPAPRWYSRLRSHLALKHVRDLTARPMLLAYLDDLTRDGRTIRNIADAYDEIVKQWIQREKPMVNNSAALLEFSKKLAVELYIKREGRGGEQATANEVISLAAIWDIPLERWQLTGRSLLTRDAANFYRFAHRSIMEYLYVLCFLEGDTRCARIGWTDQMYRFLDAILRPKDFIALKSAANTVVQAASSGSVDQAILTKITAYAAAEFMYNVVLHGSNMGSLLGPRVDVDKYAISVAQELVKRHLVKLLELSFTGSTGIKPKVYVIPIARDEQSKVWRIVGAIQDSGIWVAVERTTMQTHLDNPEWPTLGYHFHRRNTSLTVLVPISSKHSIFGLLVVIYYNQAPTNIVDIKQYIAIIFDDWVRGRSGA